MNITQEVRDWLAEAGYKNLCFISYPHTGSGDDARRDDARRFVDEVQNTIRNELKHAGAGDDKVFIDYNAHPGTVWSPNLQDNLAGSVAMVAILSHLYFTPEHIWCWREWKAMRILGELRHSGVTEKPLEKPIINVLFREVDYAELPPEVGSVTAVNLSRVAVSGRQYFGGVEFKKNVVEVARQIVKLAHDLHRYKCRAVSHPSAFGDWDPVSLPAQKPPLRNE